MTQAILVINAGSSSLKFTLFKYQDKILTEATSGQVAGIGSHPKFKAEDEVGKKHTHDWGRDNKEVKHQQALEFILAWLGEHFSDLTIVAAGHRVVHGGLVYTKPVQITEESLKEITNFIPLAPLHQPHNITPIKILDELIPDLEQVACFDTAFHRTMPEIAQLYPIPKELIEQDHIRRYGMHGLSYEYIASELHNVAPEIADGRVVIAHIGSGASLAALKNGKSQATTMGFTALEGVPMGTRPGSIDPGILLWLMQNKGFDADAMEKFLYHECGMLGLTGISNDFYDLELAAKDGNAIAQQAYDLMSYNVARNIGSLTTAIQGLDALVFTAGVGEKGSVLRGPVCSYLDYLGVKIDEQANNDNALVISTPDSAVKVMVVPTNEELMIAQHTINVLGK